ncbi:MAG: hypothetical protein EOO30_01985 [Comamonadaceae bacterium]|nr:MAG: hypothetical protein EOO30_01985 [Comamonadaceae bacterium]
MSKLLLLLLAGAALPAAVRAQAVWPEALAGNRPAASLSPRPARLPADLSVTPPGPEVPPQRAAFSGGWRGWGCGGFECDVALVVEQIRGDEASVVYALASASTDYSVRVPARFVSEGKELHATLPNGSTLQFRMRPDRHVDYLWRDGAADWVGGVLARSDATSEQRQRAAQQWMAADVVDIRFVQPWQSYTIRVRPGRGSADFLGDAGDGCLGYRTPTSVQYAEPYLVLEFAPAPHDCSYKVQYRADPVSGRAWAYRLDRNATAWRHITGTAEIQLER